MVSFRLYRPELSEIEQQSIMARGLLNLSENPDMANIVQKMFDYDLEVGDVEKDLLSVEIKMEPIFKFY